MLTFETALTLAALAFAVGLALGHRWGRHGVKSLVPFLILAVVAGPVLASPQEALAAVLADVKSRPADAAYYTRYFDLTSLLPEARTTAAQVLSYHVNSVSREPDIVQPRPIAGGAVLAIDLRDYNIDVKVYEKLGDAAAKEPYFHVVVESAQTPPAAPKPPPGQPGYTAPAPAAKPAASDASQKHRQSVAAPWLDKAQITELYALTKSQVPIVRGDWFFFQTAIQSRRHVGYYDLLGLGKKQADFEKLIGANAAEAKRLKLEMAASVAISGVAINNRGITRLQSLTGGYWLTADYKTSIDRQNVARLLNGDTEPPQGDASEQFGVLSNKLFAYWLQDAQGNRQDVVPQEFALDGKVTSNDRNIYAGTLSCVRCHVEGLRPINDYARALYRGPIQLRSPDYERFKRLRQLYLTDLPALQAEDNARFAAAVKQCNGLTVAENSRAVGQFWSGYIDAPLSPADVAAELGCPVEVLRAKVAEYVAKEAIVDPVIAALAHPLALPVRREHFEENVPQFMRLLGAVP